MRGPVTGPEKLQRIFEGLVCSQSVVRECLNHGERILNTVAEFSIEQCFSLFRFPTPVGRAPRHQADVPWP